MRRLRAAGLGVFCLGAAGYVAGALVAYPGRALSISVVMVGVALAVVGGSERKGETER